MCFLLFVFLAGFGFLSLPRITGCPTPKVEIKLFCLISKITGLISLAAKFIFVKFERILTIKFENVNEIKALIHVSALAVKKNPSPAEGASLWEEGFII